MIEQGWPDQLGHDGIWQSDTLAKVRGIAQDLQFRVTLMRLFLNSARRVSKLHVWSGEDFERFDGELAEIASFIDQILECSGASPDE